MLVDLYWLSPGVLGIDWHAKQQGVNGIDIDEVLVGYQWIDYII